MARRGLRKPQTRTSLRPRASQPPANVERESFSVARSVASAPAPVAHETGPVSAPERSSDTDVDRLTHSFFSRPPGENETEAWDELPPTPMALGARRAMFATLAMAGGFALLLGGYVVYQRVIMPVPVELGGGSGLPAIDSTHDSLAPAMSSVASAQAAIVGPRVATAPSTTAVVPSQPAVAAAAAPAPVDVAAAPVPAVPVPIAAAPMAVVAAPVEVGPVAAAPVPPAAAPGDVAAAPAAAGVVAAPGAPAAAEAAVADPSPVAAAPTSPADAAQAAAMLDAAHALFDRGRRKDALAAYERVLDVEPASSQVLSRLGYLHLQAGDDARARRYAARAVELDATSSEGVGSCSAPRSRRCVIAPARARPTNSAPRPASARMPRSAAGSRAEPAPRLHAAVCPDAAARPASRPPSRALTVTRSHTPPRAARELRARLTLAEVPP